MFQRKAMLVITALSLTSLAVPAGADEGLGVSTQFAGEIIAATAVDLGPSRGDDARVGSVELSGKCAFVGVTTLTGQIQFVFSGATESYSTVPASAQSIGTRAQCALYSLRQGLPGETGDLSQFTDIRLSGNAAATPPAVTPPWPLRPVLICIAGDAQFGPVPAEKELGNTYNPGQPPSDPNSTPDDPRDADDDGDYAGDNEPDDPDDDFCSITAVTP